MSLLSFAILYLIALVSAQTQNATKSGEPDRVGWVPYSPGRSSMQIVWSCASVLLVCSYKCVHLNISSFEENRAGWHKTTFDLPYWPEWPLLQKWLRKVMWIALILIGPEIGVALAVNEYVAARKTLRTLQRQRPEAKLSLTHVFYAGMGGFAAQKVVDSVSTDSVSIPTINTLTLHRNVSSQPPRKTSSTSQQLPWTEQIWKGEFRCGTVDVEGEDDLSSSPALRALDLLQYVDLCKELSPNRSVLGTEKDLQDRSKHDLFSRLFAISQSTWLIIQSIARVSSGLPLSELELATMAYVFCAAVMYSFWWHKPFGVEYVTIVPYQTLRGLEVPWRRTPERWRISSIILASHDAMEPYSLIPTVAFYSSATMFASIHLAAWNWEFGHPAARLLWRCFGVAGTVAGPLSVIYLFIARKVENRGLRIGGILIYFLWGIWVIYGISRLGLIGLTIYSFSSMPAGVYDTVDWVDYFPFFS